MHYGEPIAYFITWTVYGTHLPGDERGWRKHGKGLHEPEPKLVEWHKERLKHPIKLLSEEQRAVVEAECRHHCNHRGWRAWAINIRSTHCHAVVTTSDCRGSVVRDQLKANGTRGLRERWPEFCDRPVWTIGGDWRCINSDEDLETVCKYVMEAQDRKDRDS